LSGGKRTARLNEQLRREISEMIRRQVRDPRVGQVTITGVDVARDLGSAKVYVRTSGGADERDSTLEGLGAAAPFLRTELGRVLHLRRVPELRFRPDRSQEQAQRIEQVLSEVMPDDEGPGPDGEPE
jgi:ribosome-binding factor A